MIEIKDATAAEVRDFLGTLPAWTLRAYAFVGPAGEIQGIGGYYLQDGLAIAFSERGRLSKRDTVRAAGFLAGVLRDLGLEVFAKQHDVPGADTALRHFGFEPLPSHPGIWRLAA